MVRNLFFKIFSAQEKIPSFCICCSKGGNIMYAEFTDLNHFVVYDGSSSDSEILFEVHSEHQETLLRLFWLFSSLDE